MESGLDSTESAECARWPEARDRASVGSAVWIYLLLIRWASGPDGSVRSGESIRSEVIGTELGLRERQVRRALARLRRAGYIELENTGRGFRIRVVGPKAA